MEGKVKVPEKTGGDPQKAAIPKKRCVDCSTSQQTKCFGIQAVSRGISAKRRCTKPLRSPPNNADP